MQEFLDSDDLMYCPFVSSHKRSPSFPSSSLSIYGQDKKQYEKQGNKNRIGHAFRSSWGRKDSEHKSSRKNNLLVMTFLFG